MSKGRENSVLGRHLGEIHKWKELKVKEASLAWAKVGAEHKSLNGNQKLKCTSGFSRGLE